MLGKFHTSFFTGIYSNTSSGYSIFMAGFSNYANISIVIYVLDKLSLHLTRAFGLKTAVGGKLILTG